MSDNKVEEQKNDLIEKLSNIDQEIYKFQNKIKQLRRIREAYVSQLQLLR